MFQVNCPDTPLQDSDGVVLRKRNGVSDVNLDKLELDYEHSNDYVYKQKFNFEDFPVSLKEDWNKMARQLDRVMNANYEDVINTPRKRLEALNRASKNIQKFKLENHSLISSKIRSFLETSENSVEINKKIYRSILFSARRIKKSRKGVDKVKAINVYLEYCQSDLIPFMYDKRINLHTLSFVADVLRSISSKTAVESVLTYKYKNEDECKFNNEILRLRNNAEKIRFFISYINEIILRSDEFSDSKIQSENDLIPCQINGETIYLQSDSAEGKAIQRLNAIDSGEQVEWITDVEEDTFSDEADLDRWLSASGYL